MHDRAKKIARLWFCTFSTECVKRMRNMHLVGDPEAEKLLKLPKRTQRRSSRKDAPQSGASWLRRTRHRAEAKSFNCMGRSSSYCCSDRIISNTRSIACANSSWHDSTPAHRLARSQSHFHNHMFSLPLSVKHTPVFYGMFSHVGRKWFPSTGIPRRSN